MSDIKEPRDESQSWSNDMDRADHEKTYKLFIYGVAIFTAASVATLLLMAIFLT